MASRPRNPRNNNFDLIRLAAACQVALIHGVEHVGLRLPFHDSAVAIISCFPGIPIFFIISGFLIASSFERQSLEDFVRNRVLRIYPALWVCLAVSIITVWVSGYFVVYPPVWREFFVWLVAQATVAQFFNPEFLRGYGVGVLNGSLWTIAVEIQFYFLAPLVVLLFRRSTVLFWIAFGTFVIINAAHAALPRSIVSKLIEVTFGPWFYMFMLGAALHFWWPRIRHWYEGKLHFWLAAYALIVAIEVARGVGAHGNTIMAPYVILLSGVIMSAAFSRPRLAQSLLKNNDISYGLYIYHMPVYNLVIYEGLPWTWEALIASICCALLSWILIERPVLSLKRRRKSPVGS